MGGAGRSRNRRVASMPSIPGRFTSISTRPGLSSSVSVSDSSPVEARPTTTNPRVASTTATKACMNVSWSSTNTTRTRCTCHPPPVSIVLASLAVAQGVGRTSRGAIRRERGRALGTGRLPDTSDRDNGYGSKESAGAGHEVQGGVAVPADGENGRRQCWRQGEGQGTRNVDDTEVLRG